MVKINSEKFWAERFFDIDGFDAITKCLNKKSKQNIENRFPFAPVCVVVGRDFFGIVVAVAVAGVVTSVVDLVAL